MVSQTEAAPIEGDNIQILIPAEILDSIGQGTGGIPNQDQIDTGRSGRTDGITTTHARIRFVLPDSYYNF